MRTGFLVSRPDTGGDSLHSTLPTTPSVPLVNDSQIIMSSSSDSNPNVVPPTVPEHLICSVCTDVLSNPVIISCGHRFCQACLEKTARAAAEQAVSFGANPVNVQRSAKCPMCRWDLSTEGSLMVDVECLRELSQRTAQCGNDGCLSIITLVDWSDHQKICASALVSCPWQTVGCSFTGRRSLLTLHVSECPYEKLKSFVASSVQRVSRLEMGLNAMHAMMMEYRLALKHLRQFSMMSPIDVFLTLKIIFWASHTFPRDNDRFVVTFDFPLLQILLLHLPNILWSISFMICQQKTVAILSFVSFTLEIQSTFLLPYAVCLVLFSLINMYLERQYIITYRQHHTDSVLPDGIKNRLLLLQRCGYVIGNLLYLGFFILVTLLKMDVVLAWTFAMWLPLSLSFLKSEHFPGSLSWPKLWLVFCLGFVYISEIPPIPFGLLFCGAQMASLAVIDALGILEWKDNGSTVRVSFDLAAINSNSLLSGMEHQLSHLISSLSMSGKPVIEFSGQPIKILSKMSCRVRAALAFFFIAIGIFWLYFLTLQQWIWFCLSLGGVFVVKFILTIAVNVLSDSVVAQFDQSRPSYIGQLAFCCWIGALIYCLAIAYYVAVTNGSFSIFSTPSRTVDPFSLYVTEYLESIGEYLNPFDGIIMTGLVLLSTVFIYRRFFNSRFTMRIPSTT